MVVDKPSGVSVHNEPGRDVRSQLMRYLIFDKNRITQLHYDPEYGLHAVHRLDKETSGVLLLAGRRSVFEHFSVQFAQGSVRKFYLALVHGSIAPEGKQGGRGLWQWPLTASGGGRANPRGQGKCLPCKTRYTILQTSPRYTLLACELLTGRKHQIRRHAAMAGHPVLGDARYGPARACRHLEKHFDFKRLALHAAALEIRPPHESVSHRFEVLTLPREIQVLLHADTATDD
jgi:23S rRNA pseudouridine1911/1915/1917 synthase